MNISLHDPKRPIHPTRQPSKPSIYVIIPVHNRKNYTRSCLRSLYQQSFRDFEIIVIDDGSKDGTSKMIIAEFPDVVLLRGDGNLWWTRAVNMGVQYALARKADYIITLNDDIILRRDFLEAMMRRAVENGTALLGGIEFDPIAKKPTHGGRIMNWKVGKNRSILDSLTPEKWHGLYEVTHLPGRELLIPAEVFDKIGLFDEKNFPQTVADFDFTYRAHKAGYRVFCNYDARVETYPDTQGGIEYRETKSFTNYYNHLFGIKGKANLNRFIRFAWKNCPKRFLPSFVLIGISRRIFGYLLDWLMESVGIKNRVRRLL
jgi:GT2 family glycosyltransferase